MGKGDKKSKHGKIILGSYGVRRRRRKGLSKKNSVTTVSSVPGLPDANPIGKLAEPLLKGTDVKPRVAKKPKTEPDTDVETT